MTQIFVLGLLDLQPMSGYDIQQALQGVDVEQWGGILVGSIYHALKTLEKGGYVEVQGVEQTGHRQKAIYRITDKGRGHLQTLVLQALRAQPALYPTHFYAGLTFLNKCPAPQVRSALEKQYESLEAEYAALQCGWDQKKAAFKGDLPPVVQYTFDHMFQTLRLQMEFLQKILSTV